MGPRRTYSAEFKREVVRLMEIKHRSAADVARSLGIDQSLVAAWRRQVAADGVHAFPGRGRRPEPAAEFYRLSRELAQARQEVAILKKAKAYFAQLPATDPAPQVVAHRKPRSG